MYKDRLLKFKTGMPKGVPVLLYEYSETIKRIKEKGCQIWQPLLSKLYPTIFLV